MQRFILLFAILFVFEACAQSRTDEKPVFEYKTRDAIKKSEHPPLLLMLHGYGSNEDDLFPYAEHLDERFVIVSVRAPYAHSAGNYAWYSLDFSKNPYTSNNDEAEKSRQDLGKFIDQMCKKYHCDKQKVFMLGFSQGAMMSLTCALTMPKKIAGAVVLSGKLRDEVKPLTTDYQQVKNTKIYISHGKQDTRVPFSEVEKAKAFLEKIGITPTIYTFDAEHTVTQESFMDFRGWLSLSLN